MKIIVGLFLSLNFAESHTQPKIAPLKLAPAEHLLERMKSVESKLKTKVGYGVAIISKGQVIYKSTGGVKALGSTDPITSSTRMPLASSSKPVTALLMAWLVKEGKLTLKDSVDSYFGPSFKGVAVKHLLSHSTGVKNEFDNIAVEQGKSRAQILEKIKAKKKSGKTGEYYSYNNLTFSLIEDVILDKTGATFLDALGAFFSKLGADAVPEDIALPHRKFDNGNLKVLAGTSTYTKVVPSAGGLSVSLDQMIALLKLAMGDSPEILTAADLKVFFTPYVDASEVYTKWGSYGSKLKKMHIKSDYALGWRVFRVKGNSQNQLVFHSGFVNGARSFIGFIPDMDLGFIILVNQDCSIPVMDSIDMWLSLLGVTA